MAQGMPERAWLGKRDLVLNMCSVSHRDMARTQGSHSDITGPKIRSTALRLFAERGYAAVSMRQIAAEVGVQAGALYNYTPDKQTLLFTLMEEHMSGVLDALPKMSGDPVTRLEAFVRFHLAHHRARGDEIFIAYNELRNLEPENFDKIEVMRRAFEDALEDILRAGAKAGLMHVPEPKITTMAIIGMLTGFSTWYKEEGRLSITALQDVYWDMVRGLVGLPSETKG